ncbi:MAG: response regulator [Candidatus Omnitrophota bacterium]
MADVKLQVLVVDDEKGIRDFFMKYLSLLGMDASEAENGNKAVEIVKNRKFDIYFIDVRMPGMNGLETFRAIKQMHPEAIGVMMTGYEVEEILEKVKEDGAYNVLHKPFDLSEIKAAVDAVVKMKGGQAGGAPMNVLVVDDDKMILRMFGDFLTKKNIAYSVARNKQEALALLKEKKFELVFLDLILEECKGVELYKEIKAASPDTVIVLITAFPQLAKEAEGQTDASGCLFKPFDMADILPIIDKARTKPGRTL